MRKIRIAQVITRMDWGGSPDIVRILCERLDHEIYEIKLIYGKTLHPSKKNKDFLKKSKDKIFYIPSLKRKINIFNDLFAFLNLYYLFRKEKFDIVHTHTAKVGVAGRVSACLARVSHIVHTPHGHNFYGYFGPLMSKMVIILEKILAIFTDKIITLTELEKEDYVRFKVAGPEKIVVVNSGVELENYRKVEIDRGVKRAELGIGENKILIGMIGRLEPVKGPEYFVQAAKLVMDRVSKASPLRDNTPKVSVLALAGLSKGLKFLIVGEGSLKERLESQCRKLGIRDKVIFTGWREDIPEILSILDILVLSSLNEAVGRILIEAGALGVPVVATRVGGVPEIVKDNETGILVPSKDSYSLAKAMITLLENKDKRTNLGNASKKWIDEKFSAEEMVKKFSNLYKEFF